MRLVAAAILLCLVTPLPAGAQTPKNTKTAPPAIPPVYATMPVAERIAIQSDLIWVGLYNGIAVPEFGARAIAAVKAYQKQNRQRETGVLEPPARAALAA